MTVNEIAALLAIVIPGVAWMIRLESKIKENQLKQDIEMANHARDLQRVEAELKEMLKSSIRTDEKMADALNKLSLNMERTMERMEHMNTRLVGLQLKQENSSR